MEHDITETAAVPSVYTTMQTVQHRSGSTWMATRKRNGKHGTGQVSIWAREHFGAAGRLGVVPVSPGREREGQGVIELRIHSAQKSET